jgi:DNA-directed RNA polymerase specialized sigma subunit
MTGRKFTEREKQFRAKLRDGVCKARLARWFVDAGLSDSEKDVLYRAFLKGQSREQIASDVYTCKATVSRKITAGINKLMDYFEFAGMDNSNANSTL